MNRRAEVCEHCEAFGFISHLLHIFIIWKISAKAEAKKCNQKEGFEVCFQK